MPAIGSHAPTVERSYFSGIEKISHIHILLAFSVKRIVLCQYFLSAHSLFRAEIRLKMQVGRLHYESQVFHAVHFDDM
jgi:hypothetical protein